MTITDTTPHLRDMTDQDVRDLYREADELTRAAAVRELNRRDREDRLAKSRARLAEIQAEGERQAYAQYREASASDMCKGKMLSVAGLAAFDRGEFTSEEALWRMPWDKAQLYASEELCLWWKYTAPRVTARDYVKQQAAEKRGEYAQHQDTRTREAVSNEHHDRTGLGSDEAGALRRGAAAPQAPERAGRPVLSGRRDHAETEAASQDDTGTGRPGQPVQRDGADVGIIGTAIAADRALKARQDARQEQAVAVPSGAPAAYRPAGAVTREPRIPGDQLLDLLRDAWFGYFARFPSPAALDAVTLWAAHTHMRNKDGVLVFRATPRLFLLSSEPGSGKGRVLELLMQVVPNCYGLDLEPTKAGLVHTINKERATVLLDEADILFGSGDRSRGVRAVINGGTYCYGTVTNGRGDTTNRVPVFGPLALAGLDVMEKTTGDKLNALLSRGVKIRMEKASGEGRPPKLTRQAEESAGKAKVWLERWAAQVRDEVAAAAPEIPDGVEDRPDDIWTPLLAVADAAGGEWPERARAACVELALGKPDGGEDIEAEFAGFASEFASL